MAIFFLTTIFFSMRFLVRPGVVSSVGSLALEQAERSVAALFEEDTVIN
jgi:hypothetical protein